MKTNLLYFEHPDLLVTKATLIDVGDDEFGSYCICDQTIFYPQGGGQACDTGELTDETGKRFPVNFVSFINEQVRHYGPFETASLNLKSTVTLKADHLKRAENARGHTAGHLVHLVMEELEPGLQATKGHHFPKDAYIRFSGSTTKDREKLIIEVNDTIKDYINKNMAVTAELLTKAELEQKVKNIPFDLPEDKPLRVISIGNYAMVPCGGTHVKSLGELNQVEVTKIKHKKGNTVVSYTFN